MSGRSDRYLLIVHRQVVSFYNCFKDDYMENIGYSYSRKYFYNSESLRRAKQALRLSKQSGMTLQDIVLGYTLAQPFPVLPIVGPQRPG